MKLWASGEMAQTGIGPLVLTFADIYSWLGGARLYGDSNIGDNAPT
jgi:hypothetical protein